MNSKIQGTISVMYINHGTSKKGKPYLVVATGRKEIFFMISEEVLKDLDERGFAEDDIMELVVVVQVGSDRAELLEVL